MVHKGPRPEHRRATVGRPYRRLQAWVFTTYRDCWICGLPVDKTLPFGRWSKSLDHVVAVKLRPDLALERSNARLAHLGCNSSKGDGTKRARKVALVTSVRW